MAKARRQTKAAISEQQSSEEPRGFLGKYGPYIFLAVFAGYLVLLTIGVIAEIFDIQSILDWWIWRPPGKPPG